MKDIAAVWQIQQFHHTSATIDDLLLATASITGTERHPTFAIGSADKIEAAEYPRPLPVPCRSIPAITLVFSRRMASTR